MNELYNKVEGLFKFIDNALKENGSIFIDNLADFSDDCNHLLC